MSKNLLTFILFSVVIFLSIYSVWRISQPRILSPEEMKVNGYYGSGPKDKEEAKAFSAELKAKSTKGGYDIIYDPIGDCYAEPAFRAIGWKGKYLVVGFAAGQIPKLPINLTLLKGASVVGVFWGAFTGREFEENQKNISDINEMLGKGQIKPLISKEIPMENAVEAIKLIGSRGVVGKVVLVN